MSSDLIAGVVAIAFGVVVVGMGLRRNLSDVTRSSLPRYVRDPEATTIATELYDDAERRNQLSPLTRKLNIGLYLFMGLAYATFAALGTRERLMHVGLAALFAVAALMFFLRRPSSAEKGQS
jgi:hypothetical protein